jgi:hypothetical protein
MYHKSHMRYSSIPQSAISGDDMSSVSGTTLARALIGNSFVLSNDHRLSRNRTGLTRTDSTTLPRHSSTYWSDKRVSGGEVVVDPDSSIPPVPPVPADLTSPRHNRRSFAPEPSSVQIPAPIHQPHASNPASNSRDSLGYDAPDDHQQQEIPESQSHFHPSMDPSSSEPNTPPIQAPSSSNHSVISLSASFTTAKTTSSKGSKSSRTGTTPPPLPLLTQPFVPHRTTSEPNSAEPLSVGVDSAFAGYEFATPVLSPGTSSVDPTSEESFSLSPYLSEADKDKVDSKKKLKGGSSARGLSPSTPKGQVITTAIISIADGHHHGTGKVDWIFPRRSAGRSESNQSLTASHLPIGDRPRSLLPSQAAPRDNAPPPVQPSAPMTKRIGQLINAPFSPSRLGRQGLFNRQRSGSTPNPITVTRDSQDFNTYNISIGTAADVSPSTAGLSGNQTFPETPSAFSPMWSEGSVASPLRNEASEYLVVGNAAEITRSVSFSGGSSSAPNLAQQILLTRAATTVRGTRAGLARPRIVPSTHPYANARNMSVLLTPPPEEPPDAESPTSTRIDDGTVDSVPALSSSHGELPVAGSVRSLQSDPSSPHSQGSSNPSELLSLDSTIASPSLSPNAGADPLKKTSPGANTTSNISSPGPGINIHGVRSTETLFLDTSLAIDKSLPPLPPITPENQTNQVAEVLTSSVPTSPDPAQPNALAASGVVPQDVATVATSPPPIRPFPSPPPPTRPIPSPPSPTQLVPSSPQASVRSPRLLPQPKKPRPLPSQTSSPTTIASPPIEPPPSSTPIRPRPFPPTPTQSFMSTRPTNSLTLSLGAPPPYYSIVPAGANAISPFIGMDMKVTPGSSISSTSSNQVSSPSYSSSPPANTGHSATSMNSGASSHSSPRNRRDGKARPPLPMGPRKPVSTSSLQGIMTGNHVLDRNASVSSSGTNGRARAFSNASSAPRFQIPPVKWRGYTIDAAKWTFTSAQLQGIVSRAIRQSAEASSLRLLQLETLDNELPDEMHRLEMQGMDVKSRYKVLSRKRWNLLASLAVVFDGVETGDPFPILDELAEVSATLDQLTEELHSIDEQIGQLKSLRDIHSASALAMALRKLNSSFLKQLAETQKLRSQVEALEAERDEAWKQAEDVANEYDDLTENLRVIEAHSPLTPGSAKFSSSSSRRSSRVMAVRKSSIRVSKAGLRPSRSQRSSVSSIYRTSVASSSAVRSTFPPDNIPPVPPIPRPHPPGIVTADLQSRISMGKGLFLCKPIHSC